MTLSTTYGVFSTLTRCLKTLWGAHHFIYSSKDVADIASVINVSPEKVVKLIQSHNWDEVLLYWNYALPLGDLNLAQQLWTELVEKGEHINLVDYPDTPNDAPGDPSARIATADPQLTLFFACLM